MRRNKNRLRERTFHSFCRCVVNKLILFSLSAVLLLTLFALYQRKDIGEYRSAQYSKYNSLASKNGLLGNKIYIKGKFEKIETAKNSVYAIFKQENKKEWVFDIGLNDEFDIDIKNMTDLFSEKEIILCGEYLGYSENAKKPAISFDAIIIGEESYKRSDFIIKKENETKNILDAKIEIDDKNYINYTVSSNGNNKASSSLCYFDGNNLEKEYATISVISIVNKEIGIKNFIIHVKSNDDVISYAFIDGNLAKKEGSNKYDFIDLESAFEKYSDELTSLIVGEITREQAIYGVEKN